MGEYHNSTGFDHAFLRYAGQTYTFDDPNATQGTQAYAVNGVAAIAGTFQSPFTSFVEYPFPPNWTGNFISFSKGGAQETIGYGIDNDNDLVGYYVDSSGNSYGFLLTDNVLVTTFQLFGSNTTVAEGVSDFGQVVGSYRDSSGNHHAFLAAPQ